MPTLIREEGFEVRIYTLDHPPPHVHVAKAGAMVRLILSTQRAVEIVRHDLGSGRQTRGAPGGSPCAILETGVGEAPWPRLT